MKGNLRLITLKSMRKIYYGLIFGFVLMMVMWTCVRSFFVSMCGNEIITEESSPGGKYKIVVFVRSCGATTGFSTQVSIIPTDRKLRDDESGNVLTLNDHNMGNHRNSFGGADVKAKWITNREVIVKYDKIAETAIKETNVHGVEIVFELK